MLSRVILHRGVYRDSITLLRVSQSVEKVEGVFHAAVVMATPLNMRVLSDLGFKQADVKGAKSDDLVIALQARDQASLARAAAEAVRLLASDEQVKKGMRLPRTLSEAMSESPDSNIALISVPGQYAKREAADSLAAGLNVFLFSSNVSREDELELKRLALKKNLLMMGPDCGTAIINNVVLGFGNAVREGSIGLVSASGTGLQEVSTLIHRSGLGISQAIGSGGGDLSDIVGGLTTLQALKLLEKDPKTKVIVVISKPPGARTHGTVLAAIRKIRKPVVVNFLGSDDAPEGGKMRFVRTLKQAAEAACEAAGTKTRAIPLGEESKAAFAEAAKLASSQRYIRGLYAGGTLCYESQMVLTPLVGRIYSNTPLEKKNFVGGNVKSRENSCIDMGAEEFVVGRAHPMIDFTLRKIRIIEEAKDPKVAVLLLDVELGLGSNPDPAGELVPAITEAKSIAAKGGRYLSVVASLVGTEGDFQNMSKQADALRNVGVIIAQSNAGAAELSGRISTRKTNSGGRV